MMRIDSLLRLSGRVLLTGLFAAILLAPSSPVQAAENDSGNAQHVQQAPGGKEQVDTVKKGTGIQRDNACFEDKGCMARTQTGDPAFNGGTCTSGMVCVYPGASCALGGAKHCRTWNLGGGNCTCACM
jgi:hypothetical protein